MLTNLAMAVGKKIAGNRDASLVLHGAGANS